MANVRKLTGQTIGNYQLHELYGAGGMGAVYRAFQMNLERDVAFKVMSVQYSDEAEFIKRFQREAKLAASLEHPNIVPIHDYGTYDNEILYVVMRLLTGGSLMERILQRQGQLPSPGEVSIVLKQLASALDYAHSKGIIHRDVKSGNIMFDNHGTAYLVDFGIARLLQDNSTRITADGTTVGTPTHMAPEQWLGENPTPAADQYALAVVVYELLTGRLPFNAPTPYALMSQHLNQMPPPPQKLVPTLTDGLTAVVGRALAKDKKNRYPTATAFAMAFEEAVASNPGKGTQMFKFPLRRDLLHTDVVPNAPHGSAASAVISAPTGDGLQTLPFNESDIFPSGKSAAPAAESRIRPMPKPQAMPSAAVPAPVPQNRTRASVAQAAPVRPSVIQPLRPVAAAAAVPAPQGMILEPEKPKNDDRAPGSGIASGVVSLIGRVLKLLLSMLGFVLKQMVKSTISFVVSLVLSTVLVLVLGSFVVSMLQNNMDVGLALKSIGDFVSGLFQQAGTIGK